MPTRERMGDSPVWSPRILGSANRRNSTMTPHTAINAAASPYWASTMSTTAQGTMTVPAPMMGMKSSTARAKASSRP